MKSFIKKIVIGLLFLLIPAIVWAWGVAFIGASSPTSSGPPAIGGAWEGGYYAGSINISGTDYYIVCAAIAGQGSNLNWKTANSTTTGTTSTTDGFTNTAAMVTAGITAHPAGEFCVDLTIEGKTDWYLPSKDELAMLYTNRAALEAGGSGSFASSIYFSSSEYSSSDAWYQDFSDSTQGNIEKVSTVYVRAVRRVAN